LLDLKDFVEEIDGYLALRTDIICTEACPCALDSMQPWANVLSQDEMEYYRE